MARKASRLGSRSAVTSTARTLPSYRVLRPRIRPSQPYFIPSRAAPARRQYVPPPVRRRGFPLPKPVRYLMRTGLGGPTQPFHPVDRAQVIGSLLSRDSFAPRSPLRSGPCARRSQRREVMHATGYAGTRFAASRPKRYNANSFLRCV